MSKTIIKPQSSTQLIDLQEFVKYQELIYTFVWRDLKVRYKQTFLGVAWVVFQPLITTIIFSLVFGGLSKNLTPNLPFPIFVLIGLVFWIFFSNSLIQASNSLLENEEIIKKVYFPKIILPLTKIITGLIDFMITFLLLLVTILVFHFSISISFILWAFLSLIIVTLASLGLGFFLSALNLKYRDVKYILPFLIQILIFVSPVIYSLNSFTSNIKLILALNPLTGPIETTRASLASAQISYDILLLSLIMAIIIFFLGLFYFRSVERFFADLI
jgi:lipopolysaccharide transport system permease protein